MGEMKLEITKRCSNCFFHVRTRSQNLRVESFRPDSHACFRFQDPTVPIGPEECLSWKPNERVQAKVLEFMEVVE